MRTKRMQWEYWRTNQVIINGSHLQVFDFRIEFNALERALYRETLIVEKQMGVRVRVILGSFYDQMSAD